jgi:hypothetical protein
MSRQRWMLTLRRRWPGLSSFGVAPLSSSGRLSTPRVPGRRGRCLGLAIDLAADEARNLLPDAISVDGPVPVGVEPAGLLPSAEQLLRRVTTREPGPGCMACGRRWPTWCGRRTPGVGR